MVSASTSSEEDVNSLQGVAEGYMVQCKDAARAALRRERGNSSFQIRDYTAATLHYSQVNRYWDELKLHTAVKCCRIHIHIIVLPTLYCHSNDYTVRL